VSLNILLSQSRSLKVIEMGTVSYSHSIATMAVSLAVSTQYTNVIDDYKSLFAVADLFYDNMLFRLLLEMLLQTFKPRVVQIQLSRV